MRRSINTALDAALIIKYLLPFVCVAVDVQGDVVFGFFSVLHGAVRVRHLQLRHGDPYDKSRSNPGDSGRICLKVDTVLWVRLQRHSGLVEHVN